MQNIIKSLKNNLIIVLLTVIQTLLGVVAIFLDTLENRESFSELVRWIVVFIIAVEFIQVLYMHLSQAWKNSWWKNALWVVVGTVFALLVNFYSYYRSAEWLNFTTLVVAFLTIHTLPLVVIYFKTEPLKHWRYTFGFWWELFVSYVLAGLMFIGMSVAFAAIEFLFGGILPNEIYMYLSVVMFLFVARSIFLSRRPLLKNMAADWQYPHILELANKFLLIPLVLLNIAIIGVYFLMTLFGLGDSLELTLPGYILALFTPGLIGLALQLPSRKESRVFKIFGILTAVALLVYVLPYFFVVFRNLSQYGFAVYLGNWLIAGLVLAIVGASYLIVKEKFFPIALFTLGVLPTVVIFTPVLNSYSIAASSQTQQLVQILATAGRLTPEGEIQEAIDLRSDQYLDASNSLSQLRNVHGFSQLQSYVNLEDYTLTNYGFLEENYYSAPQYEDYQDIQNYLLGTATYTEESPDYSRSLYFSFDQVDLNLDISNYDSVQYTSFQDINPETGVIDRAEWSSETDGLIYRLRSPERPESVVAEFDLGYLLEKRNTSSNRYTSYSNKNISQTDALVDSSIAEGPSVTLLIQSLTLVEDSPGSDTYKISQLNGYLFVNQE